MTQELKNIITDVVQQLTKDLIEPIGNAIGEAVSKAYNQGVYDGSIAQKEQMMKDAIDWEVEGEKVKVIIIKEGEK